MPNFLPSEPGQYERIVELSERILKPISKVYGEVVNYLFAGVDIPGIDSSVTFLEVLFGYALFMYLLIRIGKSVAK